MFSNEYFKRRPDACTTKRVQHTQGIFSLSGLTYPNKRDPAKRSNDDSYQLGKSTQGWVRKETQGLANKGDNEGVAGKNTGQSKRD